MNVYANFYFKAFFIFIQKNIYSLFIKKDTFYLQKSEIPFLGPKNLIKHSYIFNKKKYNVILNHDVTDFLKFMKQMKTFSLPILPNKALTSKRIDTEMFNKYIGPLCDFHYKCIGVYIPYSIDFFLKEKFTQQNLSCVYVYDTNSCRKCFQSMKKILPTSWMSDCMAFENNTNSKILKKDEKKKK